MNGLEERIVRAADDVHRLTRDLPSRPADQLRRRQKRRRALTGIAAVALGVGLIGGTALFLGGSPTGPIRPLPAPVAASGTGAPKAALPAVDELPILGIDGEDWTLVAAGQTDACRTVASRGVEYLLPGDPPASAFLQILGIPAGSECEGRLWWMNETGFEPVQVRGHDGRLFSDGDGWFLAWRESETAVVTLALQPGGSSPALTREAALAVAESVTELDPGSWAETLRRLDNPATTTTMAPVGS